MHAGELAGGDTDGGQHVTRALAQGPPLSQFDARLAQVEFAAARGDRLRPASLALPLDPAEGAGYLVNVPRLCSLAGPQTISPGCTPATRDGSASSNSSSDLLLLAKGFTTSVTPADA